MTWLIDYQITLQLMFLWSINRLIVALCSTILYTVLLILLVCNIFFLWVTLLWRWHFSSCKISPETEEFSIQFVKDFNVTFLVFIPLFVKAFKTDGLSAVLQDTPSQVVGWKRQKPGRDVGTGWLGKESLFIVTQWGNTVTSLVSASLVSFSSY